MKKSSFNLTITALAIGIGVATAALAQGSTGTSPGPTSAPSPTSPSAATQAPGALKGPVVSVETVSIRGKVIAIDPAKRQVVVRGNQGHMATMYVGPNVRNFENLKLGDQVTMRYTEALALAIAKGGTESQLGEIRTKVEADAARQAAPGGKPGVAAMERATLVANVFQIDRERGVVTLRGTDGVPVDIKVPDKSALDQLKLNDQVVIGYRQSAALSIEPG